MKSFRWLSSEIRKLTYHFFNRLAFFPLLLYATWLKLCLWSRCDHERNYCCIGRCQIKIVHQTRTQMKGSHAHGGQKGRYTLKWWIQAGVTLYESNWPIITMGNFSWWTFCLCFHYRLHDNDYHCFYKPSLIFYRRKLLLILLNGQLCGGIIITA